MGPTVLFQITFNFIYSTFSNNFQFQQNKRYPNTPLKTTKQGVGETFFEDMTRWKNKASRMVNRPNKKDQINMIIKNLLPVYNSRLLSSPLSSFGELCDCGTRIEDALNNGQLEKGESKPPTKKKYGGGTTTKAPKSVNVSAIIPQ